MTHQCLEMKDCVSWIFLENSVTEKFQHIFNRNYPVFTSL
jgi:hypothetical protein